MTMNNLVISLTHRILFLEHSHACVAMKKKVLSVLYFTFYHSVHADINSMEGI